MNYRKLCLLLILFLMSIPTFAHDGHLHPDDLEYVLSGFGLIAMILTGTYVHISKSRQGKKG